MINRITSFFTHQRKNIMLYFDQERSESISVEITPEKTISQLYIENINQISVIKAKIFLKKKKQYISNSQQRKEYCFLLINKNDPYIRIRLKDYNIPWEILGTKGNSDYSLYYILNENYYYSYANNGINRRLNNLTKNKSQNEPKNNKPISDETRIINFVSPENKIMDGEIEKYSYTERKFKNKFIYIDNNKLMYKDAQSTYQKFFNSHNANSPYNESTYIKNADDDIYDTQNLWSIIPLSIIYSVNKNSLSDLESLDIDVKKYGERLFVIRTFKKEKLILRAQNNVVRDRWFEIVRDIVEQVQIDKYFYIYNKEINENIKELYLTKLKFIYQLFNIKGIIALKEARKIFFDYYDNLAFKKIIDLCIEYKLNSAKNNNCYKSYEQLKSLVEFLGVDNFEEDTQYIYEKDFSRNEIDTNDKVGNLDKKYILNNLMDEETKLKLINIYQTIRQRTLSFKGRKSKLSFNKKSNSNSNINLMIDDQILENLFKNVMKKVLVKEHKRVVRNNPKFYIDLSKINAIQFCKYNNFNISKMNVLCEEEKENNILPDKFSDLDDFL